MCAAICAVSCVATHLQVIDGKRVVCAVCCVAGCVAGCAVLCVVSKEACPRSLSREAVGRIRRLLGGQGSLPPKLVAGGRQEAKEAVAGGRSRGCSGAGSGGLGGCWRGLAQLHGVASLNERNGADGRARSEGRGASGAERTSEGRRQRRRESTQAPRDQGGGAK